MKIGSLGGFLGLALATASAAALAMPFSHIRIGDVDGFGYTPTTGWMRATGSPHNVPADTNGNGLLEPGEFLPDRNLNGNVQTGGGDDFDNRSPAEKTNSSNSCVGCSAINAPTTGSHWTDLSLSTSWTASGFSSADFPDGNPSVPNEAVFNFDFGVLGSDIVAGSSIFLNVVFGDYDVSPASVQVTRANGSSFTIPLTLQGGSQDGLIQAATATMGFSDVFTAMGADWHGNVNIRFVNPSEPYLSFDYAELSLIPLVSVPEPGSLALVALALAALLLTSRDRPRRRRAARQ